MTTKKELVEAIKAGIKAVNKEFGSDSVKLLNPVKSPRDRRALNRVKALKNLI